MLSLSGFELYSRWVPLIFGGDLTPYRAGMAFCGGIM